MIDLELLILKSLWSSPLSSFRLDDWCREQTSLQGAHRWVHQNGTWPASLPCHSGERSTPICESTPEHCSHLITVTVFLVVGRWSDAFTQSFWLQVLPQSDEWRAGWSCGCRRVFSAQSQLLQQPQHLPHAAAALCGKTHKHWLHESPS